MATVKWYGEQFKNHLHRSLADRLTVVGISFTNAVKEQVSEASPPPSDPGEPPHKATGRLRASYSYEVDKKALTLRCGTNVAYGKFLELGTFKMAARPILVPTLNELWPDIVALIKGEE